MLRISLTKRGLFSSSIISFNNKASFSQLSGSLNAASTSPALSRPANPVSFGGDDDVDEFVMMNSNVKNENNSATESATTTTTTEQKVSSSAAASFSFTKSSPSPITSKGAEATASSSSSSSSTAKASTSNSETTTTAKASKSPTTAEEAIKQHIQQRMPAAVASMSDAEFDENIKVLKQIASKSARSFAIFIFGILALGYARRVKAKQQQAEEEEERKKKNKGNADDDDDEEAWKDLPAAERYLKEMRSQGWDVEGQNKEREEMKKKEAQKIVLDELNSEEGKSAEKKQ